MRTTRELLKHLYQQPSMEHVQAAMQHFANAELERVRDWASERMPRIAAQYLGGMAEAEADRRRKLAEEVKAEIGRMDEEGGLQ